jgi:protein-disulfide isomerase
LIYPSLKPVGDIATPEAHEHPQAVKTSMGDPNAKVKVDAYEDFQCPACRQFTEEVEPQLIKNLIKTGKVYYIFHQYSFIDGPGASQGGESDQAANASMCAAEQNKFWEMHDTIFANWAGEGVGAYNDRRLRAFAQTAGLDMSAFDTCFGANKYKADIQASFDEGNKIGVSGTPSVFVNGQIVKPGYIPSYDDILQAVNAALGGG